MFVGSGYLNIVLKKDLKKAKTAEDRVKVTEAFFAEKPMPQAGDIVVVP